MMEIKNSRVNLVNHEHGVAHRTGRFYFEESGWYFSVREKGDQGPYESKKIAELSLTDYLSEYINDAHHLMHNKIKMI